MALTGILKLSIFSAVCWNYCYVIEGIGY